MDERDQILNSVIEAAKSGDVDALAELSSIALGGNKQAQTAINEIDRQDWKPSTGSTTSIKSMVWPREVEEGKRGPQLGDVALNNDL